MLAQMLNHMPGIARRTENYTGLARMQPVEAEKVQPVHFRYATSRIGVSEFVEDRKVDP